MEDSISTSFAKTSQALADKAADKARRGIRSAHDTVKDAGSILCGEVDDLRNEADSALTRVADRAQSTGRQGLVAITDMASQARDGVLDTSDSIVAYAKKNPVRALALTAAVGALLYAVLKKTEP
jgi:ElaB/YqjD/DUF883 family membrane-anchored ribosome-binding protein